MITSLCGCARHPDSPPRRLLNLLLPMCKRISALRRPPSAVSTAPPHLQIPCAFSSMDLCQPALEYCTGLAGESADVVDPSLPQ
eukprot:3039021-Amphidinium_carterae.1